MKLLLIFVTLYYSSATNDMFYVTIVFFYMNKDNIISITFLGINVCYIIDLATTLLPQQLNSNVCINTAILVCAIYSKSEPDYPKNDTRYHFEYVCLKLSLCLLRFADNENDNRGNEILRSQLISFYSVGVETWILIAVLVRKFKVA